MDKVYKAWGLGSAQTTSASAPISWPDEARERLISSEAPCLAIGNLRSYGDVCLNSKGITIETLGLNRFLEFDQEEGTITVEAGVLLGSLINFLVPRGWFPPVVPGTKHITIGGAIANDIHGKNHHLRGTFGSHITRLGLARSDGNVYVCSSSENPELFQATIGGLGLTGVILWAEVKLKEIKGNAIKAENIPFSSLSEFFSLTEESKSFEYTVAWVDGLASGDELGRGVFMRGAHAPEFLKQKQKSALPMPIYGPEWAISRPNMKAFNKLYHWNQGRHEGPHVTHHAPFFFPLDILGGWNKLYGKRGFFQYQSVIPPASAYEGIKKMLEVISRSGEASFLAVLKTFGPAYSPGLLSFPRKGVTLAMDFPDNGEKTRALFNRLDIIVKEYGGALYPAKDLRMSPEMFELSFPRLPIFEQYKDPKFSSDMWQRLRGGV